MGSEQRLIQEEAEGTPQGEDPRPPLLAREQQQPHRRSEETPGDAGNASRPGHSPGPPQHKAPARNWAREDSPPAKERAQGRR